MENIKELLKRYKDGSCTPDEQKKVEAWYDSMADTGQWNWGENDKIAIKQELKSRIDQEIGISRRKRVFGYRLWWVAASIILLLLAGIAFYQNPGTSHHIAYLEKAVPAGKKEQITLSDGSTVFLNGSSILKYPENFSGDIREVTLVEGEAFFDIRHNEQKPFIVKANGINIRVLGTAFNVRSYNTLEDIRVTVARGKVAVNETADTNKPDKHVLLIANEQVSISKHSSNLQKSHVDSKTISGWREGKFIFDNESLGSIAATLHYARNITIRFAEEDIKAIHCSARFESSDSLEDIMFALSKANGLNYTVKNNEVVLKK